MDSRRAAVIAAARARAWLLGLLSWKLDSNQFAAYQKIMESSASRFVLEIARRWGKTWLLCVIAIEICLRKPKARVVYGAPTLKHLAIFIQPTIEAIIEDAPPECKPRYDVSRGCWIFPNGSQFHLFGADDKRKANRGRGPAADACFFDECGFTPLLKYILKSIFRPQLLSTGGRTFLGSTPAEEPDHDFTEICERAEANGNWIRRTVYDCPRYTPERIKQFIEEDAKEDGLTPAQYVESDDFRREYLAERVINKILVVVPEWAAAREKCFVAVPRPEYFNGMTVLDFGGSDPHSAHLGYWHFPMAKWVVEDEVFLRNGENSKLLAEVVKAKEREHWGADKWDGALRAGKEDPADSLTENLPDWMAEILTKEAPQQPHSRWADNDLQLIRDLYELHGLAFIPTAKDDKEMQVNNLRVLIGDHKLLIHPRCVHHDRHLRVTTWRDHRRKEFKRTAAGEHGDCVDDLVYGARNLDRRNPFPPGYGAQPDEPALLRMRRREEAKDLGSDLLGSTPLGRKLLRARR